MVATLLSAGQVADDLDISAYDAIELAIAAGVRDFEIQDEPFDDEQILQELGILSTKERESITFRVEDEQIDQWMWLTGECYKAGDVR